MKTIISKKILSLVKLVISIGIVLFLINYIEDKNIYQVMIKVDITLLLLVFLLMPLNIYIQYFRWRIVLKHLYNISDRGKVFRSILNGISSGILTPLFLGEYLGRGFQFKELGYKKIAISTFVDKTVALIILSLLGISLTTYYTYNYYIEYTYILAIAVFVFLLLILFVVSKRSFFNSILSKYLPILNDVLKSRVDKRLIVKISFLSSVFILIYITQFSLLIVAFSLTEFNIHIMGLALVLMFIKSVIPPITISDIGVRETLSIALFSIIGITEAAAFNAAIMLFCINILVPAIIGLPFLKEAK